MKILINTLIISLTVMSLSFAATVSNQIVPTNSNYIGALNATIVFPGSQKGIGAGFEDIVHIEENATGTIMVAAPFCGSYIGFECNVLLPPQCLHYITKHKKLVVSGVVTDYGLDMRSLRCFSEHDDMSGVH